MSVGPLVRPGDGEKAMPAKLKGGAPLVEAAGLPGERARAKISADWLKSPAARSEAQLPKKKVRESPLKTGVSEKLLAGQFPEALTLTSVVAPLRRS